MEMFKVFFFLLFHLVQQSSDNITFLYDIFILKSDYFA